MPRSRSPSFSAAAPRSSWLQARARARLRATGADPGGLGPDLAARRRLCRVRGRDSAGGDHPGALCVVRRYGPRVAGGRRLLCAGRARRVDRIAVSSAVSRPWQGSGEPARGSMRPVSAVAVGSRGVSAGGADGRPWVPSSPPGLIVTGVGPGRDTSAATTNRSEITRVRRHTGRSPRRPSRTRDTSPWCGSPRAPCAPPRPCGRRRTGWTADVVRR